MIPFYYILSASHSGSTLLALLLGSHPDVATVGETSAVRWRGNGADSDFCSCQATLSECTFWNELRARLALRDMHWNGQTFETEYRLRDKRIPDRLLRMEYKPPMMEAIRDGLLALNREWRARRPQIEDCNVALVEEAMRLTGARVFVDSSKEPHRLKHLMRIPVFRARAIHLIRDGRGVTSSYIRRDNWPADVAADEWRRSIVSEEHVLRRLPPEDQVRVHYEELCADVDSVVARLLKFMELDASRWNRDFRARPQHVLGNRMRINNSSEIHLDETWKQMLSREHLDTFERIAGRVNHRYGYV